MKVYLFAGKAEAGKTTAAELLVQQLRSTHPESRVVRMAYGDYLKQVVKTVFGWDGKKDEAGRHLLQWFGTDVVRAKSPNFWIDSVVRLAKVLDGVVDYLLIDDCRFPNEVDVWRDPELAKEFETGLDVTVVRIERPGHENRLTPEQRLHASETSMDSYDNYDVVLTARDLPELVFEVKNKLAR